MAKLPTPQRKLFAEMLACAKAGDETAIDLIRYTCAGAVQSMPLQRLLELGEFMLDLAERTDREDAETN